MEPFSMQALHWKLFSALALASQYPITPEHLEESVHEERCKRAQGAEQ